jgi:hypothetical protein
MQQDPHAAGMPMPPHGNDADRGGGSTDGFSASCSVGLIPCAAVRMTCELVVLGGHAR